MSNTESRILTLNILFNYPVKWNCYMTLRDFVQNFYDSKSNQDWWQDFHYRYSIEHKRLTMRMKNSGFAYEWLLHIGASSKTGKKDAAGYFGEGFKMASLCALRDFKWSVKMKSRNWAIRAFGRDICLDGTAQMELVYELSEREEQNDSVLILEGISEEQYGIFQSVLQSFFYPENPLLGEELFQNENVAVYKRSQCEIPSQLPVTSEFGTRGAVFVRYQMLGTLPFDCVIALHPYEQRSRERERLYDYEVLKVLYLVAGEVDAKTAAYLLEQIPMRWNALPKKLVDTHSWYYVVCQLIRSLSWSVGETQEFRKRHPNLLYTKRFLSHDIPAENRRRQANSWMHTQPVKYRTVMEPFKKLGYPELEAACEAAGGFADDSIPTEKEREYLSVLKQVTEKVFSGFFPQETEILCRIIRKRNSAWVGKAEVVKIRNGSTNICGTTVRFRLNSIAMAEDCFQSGEFGLALSTYLHEMAHMFGGDSTQNFSLALTQLMEASIQRSMQISRYQQMWESVGKTGEACDAVAQA